MILSDADIAAALSRGHITVTPRGGDHTIQPASLDIHLDWDTPRWGETITLEPGEFRLAHTLETITLPDDIAAQLSGKSSLGRRGLLVHATAGWIDPGFHGHIVYELKNIHHQRNITLHRRQPIAQLVFHRLTSAAVRPYGSIGLDSHYQNQKGTVPSYLDTVPADRCG